MTGPVAAIVLAAGAASRFGSPKQRLLLPHVLERLVPLTEDATVGDVVVVEGAHPLGTSLVPSGSSGPLLVTCPDWQRGPGASLRCGLAALADEVEAAVVVLADGPRLAPEAVRRVVTAWRSGRGDVFAASYDGVRGHPLLVARPAWKTVPDNGLRVLEPVLVPCDDLGAPGDVDTPDDVW